ncbi:UDP-3-O-(3-hydroxymyristoyl) glucosamine N-acyltransferase [Corallococcus sp. ZKHCc1 1396]|uniref:UDP-3-O-(3-hydroxymyristoyl) glucosamine N-acyltransferase n=1 Tax=Corallococcus soli TaxID=2710757 RepID=A0ABR9PFT4_9BACT|nr:UDP-3-O-(3-hydroxymyristoyl) glucosamine N-acyltransferase [Corallococcus soli]MBE4746709.1 UDP-3-O-(3-hydroxymyristoyl) glucosamine N-acyltransferase [Corallococcus soli]
MSPSTATASPLPTVVGPHFTLASSARLLGTLQVGPGAVIARGAVVRSVGGSVTMGASSTVREDAVVVGTPERPAFLGEKSMLGPRALVIGARVGALCDIGDGAILMPGVTVGDRCVVGEGTVIPPGMTVPDGSVVFGRPGQVLRLLSAEDLARLQQRRGGDLSLTAPPLTSFSARDRAEDAPMGQLYAFRDRHPFVHPTATLFSSAEISGDVVVGAGAIIGAGVKITGDLNGPVRIGARVQILENTVLHLLPDTMLVLEEGVVVGPGCVLHACQLGAGTVVEPGAILCEGSHLGKGCHVSAGSLVKARAVFPDYALVEGFPAVQVGTRTSPPESPRWVLRPEDLPGLRRMG